MPVNQGPAGRTIAAPVPHRVERRRLDPLTVCTGDMPLAVVQVGLVAAREELGEAIRPHCAWRAAFRRGTVGTAGAGCRLAAC